MRANKSLEPRSTNDSLDQNNVYLQVQITENTNELIQPPVEYTYQRADGTVERASSSAEVMKRCPVLGRMPVELANVMLELSARGQEIINKEKFEVLKDEVTTELINQKLKLVNKPEVIQNIIVETIPESIFIPRPEELKIKDIISQIKNPDQPEPKVSTILLPPELSIKTNIKQNIKSTNKNKTERVFEASIPTQPVPYIDIHKTIQAEAMEEISNEDTAESTLILESEKLSDEFVANINNVAAYEEQVVIESVVANEEQALLESKVEINKEIVTMEVEPEPKEIHIQLVNLVSEMLEPYELSKYDRPTEDTVNESADAIILQNNLSNSFEEYVETLADAEIPYTIETIIIDADAHPLEITLMQLAEFLSAPHLDSEETTQFIETIIEIRKVILEIQTELFKHLIEGNQNFETAQITPEVSKKIIELLRKVGYQEPDNALINLISTYGINFLIDALLYLHQLTNKNERFEFEPIFSKINFQYPQGSDLAYVLGQTLLQLMRIKLHKQSNIYKSAVL